MRDHANFKGHGRRSDSQNGAADAGLGNLQVCERNSHLAFVLDGKTVVDGEFDLDEDGNLPPLALPGSLLLVAPGDGKRLAGRGPGSRITMRSRVNNRGKPGR